jgi:molecular chaperone GrpE (heat shock protein)
MQESTAPRLAKWPFFLGYALLLILAGYIFLQGKRPFGSWEILACVVCVSVGAVLSIWPYVLEYRSAEKLLETAALTSVVAQVQNLEQVAGQIGGATAQWQSVQEAADKTARQAKEVTERMANEAMAFQEFFQKANDSEKAAMRLEIDKFRRIESDWLQVLVRILDHVHALNRAAAHSRQPTVIEQLSRFQNACHDAARRVGLTPFAAAANDKFDSQKHQSVDNQNQPAEDALIGETVANGYTFQGALLRPVLVRLQNGKEVHQSLPETTTETRTETATQPTQKPAEDELPLI